MAEGVFEVKCSWLVKNSTFLNFLFFWFKTNALGKLIYLLENLILLIITESQRATLSLWDGHDRSKPFTSQRIYRNVWHSSPSKYVPDIPRALVECISRPTKKQMPFCYVSWLDKCFVGWHVFKSLAIKRAPCILTLAFCTYFTWDGEISLAVLSTWHCAWTAVCICNIKPQTHYHCPVRCLITQS